MANGDENKGSGLLYWYVRNCTIGPMATRLERILLCLGDKIRSGLDNEEFDFDEDEGERTRASPRARRRRLREFHRFLKDFAIPPSDGDNAELNVDFACAEFNLDRTDREILLLLVRYGRVDGLEEFADEVFTVLHSASRAVATLTGTDPREVHARIASTGTLVIGGLITIESDHSWSGLCGRGGFLKLSPPLLKTIYQSHESRADWTSAVLGKPLNPSLTWEDFAHLGSSRELASRVLAGATNDENHARGVNVLLHGPVGTGKTEFCKTLAARGGMTIWSVSEADDVGGEPNRGERLASLRIAQRLLSKRAGAIILFDEAEDVLEQPGGGPFGFKLRERNGSKVHINRLLEENPLPVLWTCNEVDNIDPAVLRRMTLAIELKTPSQPVRARIWRRVLADAALDLDEHAVQRLSGRHEAPPAIAANAVRAAALADGGEREIEQAMGGVLQLLHISPRPLEGNGRDFDPRMVSCVEDLEGLAERLCRTDGPRNWSLCLYGAPGTGKSLFARYLAGRLGLEVLQKRASDLLSMWVGESEKQIAEAFATARSQNSMLVIDEADSLLSDRRGAVRSWEVTQVNEMLTWMENHPLPFVCTTNLVDRLDQASLRRFTLKLRFDPLDSAQAARAFERFFGIASPRALPEGLTPGDFATVRRKRELFGTVSPALLVQWMEAEVEAKGLRASSMGFLAPRNASSARAP